MPYPKSVCMAVMVLRFEEFAMLPIDLLRQPVEQKSMAALSEAARVRGLLRGRYGLCSELRCPDNIGNSFSTTCQLFAYAVCFSSDCGGICSKKQQL